MAAAVELFPVVFVAFVLLSMGGSLLESKGGVPSMVVAVALVCRCVLVGGVENNQRHRQGGIEMPATSSARYPPHSDSAGSTSQRFGRSTETEISIK